MIKKRANVRDVAQAAGVSVATVSRVMNNTAGVSARTLARVSAAVEALNFVPRPAARAINSGRTHLVGALVPTLDHAIFSRFLNALETELTLHGLSLVVATTDNDPERELARAQGLLDLGAEGLIVSGVTRAPGFEGLRARHGVPVVATSTFQPDAEVPTIGYDNRAAARLALDHLWSLGHRRIAVLSGPVAGNDRTHARVSALRAAAGEGLILSEVSLSVAAAAEAMSDLWAAHPHITALLCLSDVLAQGALFRCQAMGVAVPGALSIIGIDDLPSSASTTPPLTSVHLPVGRMGQIAGQRLARWVEQEEPTVPEQLSAHLIVRQSTGPFGGV
ncbi:MAG: LacI family DNA-binding transcriptional regulator [Pseudomonadota bacterium]